MIDIEFNFSNLSPLLADQIKQAIDSKVPFGLTNGRTLNVFDPAKFKGAHAGGRTYFSSGPTYFDYGNIEAMMKGISLALLSCKEFIPAKNLIG